MASLSKKNIVKYFYFFLVFIYSCAEKKTTIPTTRETINKKAVAAYVIPMGDPKLDRKFGAEIFETPETFKYLLVMYFDGTTQNDTLAVPDFGILPLMQIKPGTEKLSCIIGFLDDKNVFREYKMLAIKNDQLRLTTLKRYYTGAAQ